MLALGWMNFKSGGMGESEEMADPIFRLTFCVLTEMKQAVTSKRRDRTPRRLRSSYSRPKVGRVMCKMRHAEAI